MRVLPALTGSLLIAAVAGCGSAKIPVSTPPQPPTEVTAAPAGPTGSGPALDQSYSRRCAASLAHFVPPRASGGGTLRELRLRSPDASRMRRSIYVYRPGGVPDSAQLPVLYLLHGYPGTPDQLWTQLNAKQLLDAEFAHGGTPYEV